jgi:hypothetical protein
VPSVPEASPQPQLWPFLVARGRHVDYRVILAPKFLMDSNRTALLMRVTGEFDIPSTGVMRRVVEGTDAGDFTVIYWAAKADLGQLDEWSRPIRFTEGFVSTDHQVALGHADMRRLHAITNEAFRHFWLADDKLAAPKPAQPYHPDRPHDGDQVIEFTDLPSLIYRGHAEPDVTDNPGIRPERPSEPVVGDRIHASPWGVLTVAIALLIVGLVVVLIAR